MDHTPGFLKVVEEARSRIREISVQQARRQLGLNPKAVLIDVREDREWEAGHAAEAVHLGKGLLERDIEKFFPDKTTELILYCGGGFRSVLASDMAQRMGYNQVTSLAGGYRALIAAHWPITK